MIAERETTYNPDTDKVCLRCARVYAPCEAWRCGCEACGNILQTATYRAVDHAIRHRKYEGWKGDCRTRKRQPL